MKNQQLLSNRVGILATMHQKERVIAPLLEQELEIKVIVPNNFNTDVFGTFTREVKRPVTQIAAARLKAEKALEITGETLAIASEGSFAPHPSFPFIYSNREIIILLDKVNNLEIIGEEFSLETNFNYQVVENLEEVNNFAKKVGFPEHGIVIRFEQTAKNQTEIIKGITTEEKLLEAVNYAWNNSLDSKVYLETDMRALYNPTRMKNIEKATYDLVRKFNNQCPKCAEPGFTITKNIKGLPCAICYLPTPLTRSVISQCKKCHFIQEQLFPEGKDFADPAQCSYCNP
jgi:predicted nucleic acid-binding protein